MCLAMNADKLKEGERCASTSNRNFEGRQGRGGRTHLVSPAMAAAAGDWSSDGCTHAFKKDIGPMSTVMRTAEGQFIRVSHTFR